MSENIDVQEPVVEETIIAPVEPELPELTFEWQPVDENNRPMGGKQVIRYKTEEEKQQKLLHNYQEVIRRLRQETRKNRLGIKDDEALPDTAQKYITPLEFKKRQLTQDERFKLTRDLLDPESFDEAADMLLEAKLGAKPDEITQTLNDQQEAILQLKAKIEVDAFLASNPQYYRCDENLQAITGWMINKNLYPVRENFQLAYETLKRANILVEPEAQSVPQPVAIEPPTPVEPTPPPAPVARIPSGLNKNYGSDQGPVREAGSDIIYEVIDPVTKAKKVLTGLAAINAMPSDEFRRRSRSDPNFDAKYDRLEKEAEQARQRSRRA